LSAPNVFFLAVDSLRADALHSTVPPTPNMDRYAGSGANFVQAVATTTSTTPSFSSMLTGCYPPRHGVRGLQGYSLSAELKTMAEAFAEAGYNTHAEVTGPLLPETGVLRGFAGANHRQAYRVPFFNWRADVLEKLAGLVDPWFFLLHIWEVHRPYRAPPDFQKRWDRSGYEAAVGATDDWLGPVFETLPDDTIVVITGDHGEEYPETKLQHKMIRLARRTRDTLKTGRWLPALDRRLAELTVGHGFALHEHLVRVPLIIAGPGVNAIEVREQVRHVDLYPTLAELCELPEPQAIDGRSIVPLMMGGTLPEEPAYMEAVGVKLEGDRIAGAREPDWKLLRRGSARSELYRLNGSQAPDEKHDVAKRHPEVARRLETYVDEISASATDHTGSGMTSDEEALVEQHLRDLGYL
jgi:arylsulfatase A-like enzyme